MARTPNTRQSSAVPVLDQIDALATRWAEKEWAQRSRENRRRWALALAVEMAAVVALAAFFLGRATDSSGPWVSAAGVFSWFGVFLILLVPNPKAAVKWMLIATPLLCLVAPLVAAYFTTC